MTTPTSNEAVGRRIGVSHATVSRYKSGDRLPELDTMVKIRDEFGWSLDDQVAAREAGTYADEFNTRVAASTPVGTVGEDSTSN